MCLSDQEKFEKCNEYRLLGYLCDIHPGCRGCEYNLPDEVFVALGGKLQR